MKLDIKKNAKRNIVFGIINKVILLICPFITRAAINYNLGAEYLGLSSLFSSILSVLNLSELGINSAILSHIYKPIAQGDKRTVNSLLFFYNKIYKIIGCIVLIIGLMIIPLLPKLINGNCPNDENLIMIYLVYLVNICISYFLYAYCPVIIIAHQRDDLQSNINSFITIFLNLLQIIILYVFKKYSIYIVLIIPFTVFNNYITYIVVKRLFPDYYPEGKIESKLLGSIRQLTVGTFIQKISTVSRHSMDSIFISSFVGLVATAAYNNYYMILAGVTSLVSIFCTSFAGGIGNHVAIKTEEENYKELEKFDWAYLLISGWSATALICLYQPFMILWMGEEYLLSFRMVTLFGIYYYVLKLGDMRYLYINATGLWWEQRYRTIIEAISNIVLNYILGRMWGMYGIILASIITILFFNFYWGTKILFSKYFKIDKFKHYLVYNFKYFVINTIIFILTYVLCIWIPSSYSSLGEVIKRGIVCVFFPPLVYLMVYKKNKHFCSLKENIKRGFF